MTTASGIPEDCNVWTALGGLFTSGLSLFRKDWGGVTLTLYFCRSCQVIQWTEWRRVTKTQLQGATPCLDQPQ